MTLAAVCLALGLLAGVFVGLVLGARFAAAEVLEARRLSTLTGPTDTVAARDSSDGPAPSHIEGR